MVNINLKDVCQPVPGSWIDRAAQSSDLADGWTEGRAAAAEAAPSLLREFVSIYCRPLTDQVKATHTSSRANLSATCYSYTDYGYLHHRQACNVDPSSLGKET